MTEQEKQDRDDFLEYIRGFRPALFWRWDQLRGNSPEWQMANQELDYLRSTWLHGVKYGRSHPWEKA